MVHSPGTPDSIPSVRTHSRADILVVGAGVIGLSCALECHRRGARIKIMDRSGAGSGASGAAAGMLAPAYESLLLPVPDQQLTKLYVQSLAAWPDFAASIMALGGHDPWLRTGPSCLVDMGKTAGAMILAKARLEATGFRTELLDPDTVHDLDQTVSNTMKAGLLLPDDGQVDPAAVLAGLSSALGAGGITVERLADANPRDFEPKQVLYATGWSGAPGPPVKGQALSIQRTPYHPAHVIHVGDLYIAPKSDRTIIGATMEAGRSDTSVNEADIAALRATAAEICPGLAHGPMLKSWAGVRPGTPDGAPSIGRRADGAFEATGHFRNGFLLAPLTARLIADEMLEGRRSELAERVSPRRFGPPG